MDQSASNRRIKSLNPIPTQESEKSSFEDEQFEQPYYKYSKRTVLIFEKTWPHGYQLPPVVKEIGKGKFHCWGSAYEEFESGPGNYTIAIVELADGSILTPQPTEIKFVV